MTQTEHIAEEIHAAFRAGSDWPLPSAFIAGLGTAAAYEIQRGFVARRLQDDAIAGFKAGATAPAGQRAFGLEGPFCAVLLASGRRVDGVTIAASDFRNLLLETELCFRLAAAISAPIEHADALRDLVDGCAPAIELADAGGFGAARFTGNDLIAGNGASAAYLLGAPVDWRSPDMDRTSVSFFRDGQLLHQAVTGEIMGGQWQALRWLVNAVLELGYPVQAGHLFLTGSLGRPHPAQPGHYLADYHEFGRIGFEVV